MLNTTNDILNRIKDKLESTHVVVRKTTLSSCAPWAYSQVHGQIRNQAGTFFQISGLQMTTGDGELLLEQPIILQREISYLGIIRKKIDGEMQYLMQYKIEPGNINKIQISPTIQATKSNFTQRHGGRKPAYLDYFLNASRYRIIVDQIQSEQSSRFWGKRNRNIIIELDADEEIEVLPSHDWMTLTTLKELMRYDNLVNMDTRTVLACLPWSIENYSKKELEELNSQFKDSALFQSMFYGDGQNHLPEIYYYINNFKMFEENEKKLVPLYSLKDWSMREAEFVSAYPYSFKVVFCDIEIEGREVSHWCQPLFEANGIATFGLFTCVDNGVRKFLVRCRSEVGCFDGMEIGPSIQREYICNEIKDNVDVLFDKKLERKDGILYDTMLSEEGGRFYQEQNRNVIIEIQKEETYLPEGYYWCDYKTLNQLVQVNNTLNIQLRNLLSVLEF